MNNQQVYTNNSHKTAPGSPSSTKQAALTSSLNLQQQIMIAQQVQQNMLHPKVHQQSASFSGSHNLNRQAENMVS